MSIRAFTWAFDEVSGIGRGEKLVLLSLAEFANDDDITWRAREEIARRALCSQRALSGYLASLEAKGFIERSGRYRWCDLAAGSCKGASAHKHRCGTTYRVVTSRTVPISGEDCSTGADFAPVANKSVDAGRATKANSACVERRKVHKGKLLQVFDSYNRQLLIPPISPRCDTASEQLVGGGKKTSPARPATRQAVAEPSGQVRKSQDGEPEPPAAKAKSHSRPVKRSDGGASGGVDWQLLEEALPFQMRDLPLSAAKKVSCLLSERVNNGWSVPGIRVLLGAGSLPVKINNLAGLTLFRVKDIPLFPPRSATKVKAKPQVIEPIEPVTPTTPEVLSAGEAREVAWFFVPGVLGECESPLGRKEHWQHIAERIIAGSGDVFDECIGKGVSVRAALEAACRGDGIE